MADRRKERDAWITKRRGEGTRHSDVVGVHGAGRDQRGRHGGVSGQRLFAAVRQVLLAMSEGHFQDFLAADPILIWFQQTDGATFGIPKTLVRDRTPEPEPTGPVEGESDLAQALDKRRREGPDGVEVQLNFIYLAPTILRLNDKHLAEVVAEEVAHTILHGTRGDALALQVEGEAIALATEWGFKPHGADARLATLRQDERRRMKRKKPCQ